MTICISVRTAEGLVLAADSAVSIQGTMFTEAGQAVSGIYQTYQSASKVTQVKDYPIGVMTWGAGSIGARTIQSLVMEFENQYPSAVDTAGFTVEQVSRDLVNFVQSRYTAAIGPSPTGAPDNRPVLGLLVGGYSDKEFFSNEFLVELPRSATPQRLREAGPDGAQNFGCNWFGQTDALLRLIKGYDPASLDELVRRGADAKVVQSWLNDQCAELPLVFDGMPLQDAVDFAIWAVNVVIGRWRFGIGAPICGGAIDVAVLRPGSFEWAQRKRWSMKS